MQLKKKLGNNSWGSLIGNIFFSQKAWYQMFTDDAKNDKDDLSSSPFLGGISICEYRFMWDLEIYNFQYRISEFKQKLLLIGVNHIENVKISVIFKE